jgi:hypothetical protein
MHCDVSYYWHTEVSASLMDGHMQYKHSLRTVTLYIASKISIFLDLDSVHVQVY